MYKKHHLAFKKKTKCDIAFFVLTYNYSKVDTIIWGNIKCGNIVDMKGYRKIYILYLLVTLASGIFPPGTKVLAFLVISFCISLPFLLLNNVLASSLSFCLIFRKSRSLSSGNLNATYALEWNTMQLNCCNLKWC